MSDQRPTNDPGADRHAGVDDASTIGTPRWAKIFGLIALAVVVLVVILMLMGGHGPGRHT